MPQERASNGCSQPKKPAPKWAAPTPIRSPAPRPNSKSHNHCAEVLGHPSTATEGVLPDLRQVKRVEVISKRFEFLPSLIFQIRPFAPPGSFFRRTGECGRDSRELSLAKSTADHGLAHPNRASVGPGQKGGTSASSTTAGGVGSGGLHLVAWARCDRLTSLSFTA